MKYKTKNPIAVLAGTRRQFERYLADNRLTEDEAVYCYGVEKLFGRWFSKVEIIGTFWEVTKDAAELVDVAYSRIDHFQE